MDLAQDGGPSLLIIAAPNFLFLPLHPEPRLTSVSSQPSSDS